MMTSGRRNRKRATRNISEAQDGGDLAEENGATVEFGGDGRWLTLLLATWLTKGVKARRDRAAWGIRLRGIPWVH
jgi:hypothetical protein